MRRKQYDYQTLEGITHYSSDCFLVDGTVRVHPHTCMLGIFGQLAGILNYQ